MAYYPHDNRCKTCVFKTASKKLDGAHCRYHYNEPGKCRDHVKKLGEQNGAHAVNRPN